MPERPEKVCESQIVCKDTPKDRYHCKTALLEDHNCTCPYNKSDIKVMDEYGNDKYRFVIQKNPRPGADGICRDFEILPDVKEDLIAKLPKDLVSKVAE